MMRISLVGLLVAGACSILPEPKPARYRYVVLEAVGASQSAPARTAATVALGSVDLPTYLDSAVLVSRSAANEIRYSRDERWAEPLITATPRVLALDLESQLAGDGIALLPQGSLADSRIDVTIQHFEPDADGRATLRAGWTVHERARPEAVHGTEIRLVDQEGGPAAAGLSRLLARLGDAIAADVRQRPTALRD